MGGKGRAETRAASERGQGRARAAGAAAETQKKLTFSSLPPSPQWLTYWIVYSLYTVVEGALRLTKW